MAYRKDTEQKICADQDKEVTAVCAWCKHASKYDDLFSPLDRFGARSARSTYCGKDRSGIVKVLNSVSGQYSEQLVTEQGTDFPSGLSKNPEGQCPSFVARWTWGAKKLPIVRKILKVKNA